MSDRLRNMGGLCEILHRANQGNAAAVKVIMITVYGDDDNIFKALRAGATGYLRKVVEAFQQPATAPRDLNLSRRGLEVLLRQGFANKEIAERLSISVPTGVFT